MKKGKLFVYHLVGLAFALFFAVALELFSPGAAQAQVPMQTEAKDCGFVTACSIALVNPVAVGDVTILALRIGNGQPAAVAGMAQLAACKDPINGQVLSIWKGTVQTAAISTGPNATTIRGVLTEYSGAGTPTVPGCQVGSASPASAPPVTRFVLVAVSTGSLTTFSSTMKLEGSTNKVALFDGTQQAAVTLSTATSWAAMSLSLSAVPPPPTATVKIVYDDGTPFVGRATLLLEGATEKLLDARPFDSSGQVSTSVALDASQSYKVIILNALGAEVAREVSIPIPASSASAILAQLAANKLVVTLSKTDGTVKSIAFAPLP